MWEAFIVRVAHQDCYKKMAIVEMWAAMKPTPKDAVDAVRLNAHLGAAVGFAGAFLTQNSITKLGFIRNSVIRL
jgi:hypothetical protein